MNKIFRKKEQTSKPNLDKVKIVDSGTITPEITAKALIEKEENTQEHMNNICGYMKTWSINQNEMLVIKNHSRNEECLEWAYRQTKKDYRKKSVNLKVCLIETSKTEMQREKRIKNTEWNIHEVLDNYKRYKIYKGEKNGI